MSHHYSGPNIGFPRGDARLDLTDIFAFPHPADAGRSILIMNVHPSVGIKPPEPTTEEPFAPEALYEIKIDRARDGLAEITFQVRFLPSAPGELSATVRLIEGKRALGPDDGGKILFDGVPVSMGREARVAQRADYRFFAGWRSDPFFFDVMGTLNNFQFTGEDFFIDKDICSIVLEVPNSIFGGKAVGVWARTLVPVNSGGEGWVQADRGARPNQTPFLAGEQNDAYLAGEPVNDARFIPVFAHALEHTGGYSPGEAKHVAGTLLLDILYYDPTQPAAFPRNGRALSDDVSDLFLSVLTNGKVTGDGVGSHRDLSVDFPFLGPPHKLDRKFKKLRSLRG
jgi:hypothetical protein